MAAERHAFETELLRVCEESGQLEEDDALAEAWDERHPPEDSETPAPAADARARSAADVIRSLPYDFSPARVRCMELAVQLGVEEPPAS